MLFHLQPVNTICLPEHLFYPMLIRFIYAHRSVAIAAGILLHSLFVIGCRFTLYKVDGVHRTGRKTIPESVTEIVTHELCLTVNDSDSPLMTSLCSKTAAVAFFFVYLNNFAYHKSYLLDFLYPL